MKRMVIMTTDNDKGEYDIEVDVHVNVDNVDGSNHDNIEGK